MPKEAKVHAKKRGGEWVARANPIDPTKPVLGSGAPARRNIVARAATQRGAEQIVRDRLAEFYEQSAAKLAAASNTGPSRRTDIVSIGELVEHWKREMAVSPVYDANGVKTTGMRSWKASRGHADHALSFFGADRPLAIFDYAECRRIRDKILRTPTKWGKPRSAAHANRLMAIMRRIFNFGIYEGALPTNPMVLQGAPPLIVMSEETPRQHIITDAEEARLLALTSDLRRRHMKPFVLLMLDLGTRPVELRTLAWADVNFTNNEVRLLARNSKTSRERTVIMTPRARAALLMWRTEQPEHAHCSRDVALVFGGQKSMNSAWRTMRRDAGIPDARVYDCRHTTATRLNSEGMDLAEVGRILGHSQPQTTYRYTGLTAQARVKAAKLLARRSDRAAGIATRRARRIGGQGRAALAMLMRRKRATTVATDTAPVN